MSPIRQCGDLWWTKLHYSRFPPSTSVSLPISIPPIAPNQLINDNNSFSGWITQRISYRVYRTWKWRSQKLNELHSPPSSASYKRPSNRPVTILRCLLLLLFQSLRTFQWKTLWSITGVPWYVTNKTLHDDLNIPYITDEIKKRANRYWNRITDHENELIDALSTPHPHPRRLKKT
jgi:hypothetical protein